MVMNRRKLLKTAAVAGTLAVLPTPGFSVSTPDRKPRRVVVIGGGFAGATAAKYIRMWAPDIEVLMIEKNSHFISCPQSNLVLSGSRSLQQLTHDYQSLASVHGVKTIQAEVTAIDTEQKQVRLHDGVHVDYDRLVIAPGVDFIYDDLPMLADPDVQQKIPHAWKAGPQTELLHQQLMSMRQGGTVIMTIPPTPFR